VSSGTLNPSIPYLSFNKTG